MRKSMYFILSTICSVLLLKEFSLIYSMKSRASLMNISVTKRELIIFCSLLVPRILSSDIRMTISGKSKHSKLHSNVDSLPYLSMGLLQIGNLPIVGFFHFPGRYFYFFLHSQVKFFWHIQDSGKSLATAVTTVSITPHTQSIYPCLSPVGTMILHWKTFFGH